MRGRQEKEREKLKVLLSKRNTDFLAAEMLQNEFIKAAEEGNIEIIKYLLNNGFIISPNSFKEALKEMVGINGVSLIRYLVTNKKFEFPYQYLTEALGRSHRKELYCLSDTIIALSSLNDLDMTELVFSLAHQNPSDYLDNTIGQRFYRMFLSKPEDILDIKAQHVIREINMIKETRKNAADKIILPIITNFIYDAEEILNKILHLSKQLQQYKIVTVDGLDLLTQISRLLFKIDIENLQILVFYQQNIKGFESNEPISILEDYLDSKDIVKNLSDIFQELNKKAYDLETRVNDICKLPLNSVQPRSDVYNRTMYIFRRNPPMERGIKALEICTIL